MNSEKLTPTPLSVRARAKRQTGTWHARTKSPCEDVLLKIQQPDFCFYGLADGQSEKRHCIEGAQAVLECIAKLIAQVGVDQLADYRYPDELPALFARAIRQTLKALAQEDGNMDEFSSTLLALALDPMTGRYIILHLGDGIALLVHQNEKIQTLSPPENGFLVNYTWLTTSAWAAAHLRLSSGIFKPNDRIVMLSDGAEHICYGENIRCQAVPVLKKGTQEEIADFLTATPSRDDASVIILDIAKQA